MKPLLNDENENKALLSAREELLNPGPRLRQWAGKTFRLMDLTRIKKMLHIEKSLARLEDRSSKI